MISGNDYLKQVVCEAHERGEVFLGGFPAVRLVMLSKKLLEDGSVEPNVDILMVKETEGAKPQFFVAEMTYGSDGVVMRGARFASGDEVMAWRRTNAVS